MKRPRPVFAPIVFFAAAFLLVFWLGWTVAVQAHAADPLKHALSLLGVGLVGGGVAHLIHREAPPGLGCRGVSRKAREASTCLETSREPIPERESE